MGKHVNEKVVWWNARDEQSALRAGVDSIRWGVGKHRKVGEATSGPKTCPAYVLAGGGKHPCNKAVDGHEQHSHPIYGVWRGPVFDLDQYRKPLLRHF